MENNQELEIKKRVKAYNKTIEDWNKRQLQDINAIPFDEVCTDLIITNSTTEKSNQPTAIQLFNSLESINI